MTLVAETIKTARMADTAYDMPSTIADLFLYSAEKFDRIDALSCKLNGEWRRISSAEVIDRSERIALGLKSIGINKGDRVAILAANSPNWTLADAGCQFGGVIDVPIYTTLACDSVEYILRDSAAKAIFLQDKETYDRIADALRANPTVETVIFFDDSGNDVSNGISLAELERRGIELRTEQPDLIAKLIDATGASDVATLIYTSGTTGEPKGVMLTHANIISNVVDAAEKYSFEGRDVSLSVLPLSHIFERTGMYVYLMYGMAVHFAESIEKVPENLKEVRPTIFIGVPRIFEKVYEKARIAAARSNPLRERIFDWAIEVAKEYASTIERGEPVSMALSAKHNLADKIVYQKFRDFFGGNLRFCITGGAALADEIYLIFTGAGIRIMQGYGLTETSPVISSNNPQNVRVGTVGKPIRNVEVRIAADGEIEARGPGVMLGYYHKDEATKEVFTEDGWFRTGDIGELDEDGYLKITDRKKELFKTSGGKYIAPSPIEQRIKASRFISQAVLIGSERKFPAALIVPNFEMLESYAEHKGFELKTPEEFCADERIKDLIERQVAKETEGLSQFEKVKKIALLPAELTVDGGELTPTLKVKRRVIDEKYRAVIEDLYRN
ncbi:MAG: long-chain fatty acid--CoA ligase [Blastocatellia bacterium]|nr:long-chain fatty acid--CoA ligase [Blastocatellia bacterium]